MSSSDREDEETAETILLPAEKWWRSRYDFLHKHGYQLRIRYQPDWQPSWVKSGKNEFRCEDSYRNRVSEPNLTPIFRSYHTLCLALEDYRCHSTLEWKDGVP